MDDLKNKALAILRMDLNHLYSEVCKGKLSASSARDLISYVKQMNDEEDAADEQAKKAKKYSTEELEAMAKELLAARS